MSGWSAEQNRIRLRKERDSAKEKMKEKLIELNEECTKASSAVSKARKKYQAMKVSVEALECEMGDFESEFKDLEEREMEWKATEYDPVGNLLDAAQANLEEIRTELASKREEVKEFQEKFEKADDSYDKAAKITRQNVMPERERDVAERNLIQAQQEIAALENRETNAIELVREYTEKQQAALSANQGAEREGQKVTETRAKLEEKKVKIETELQKKITLRHRLQNQLDSAMTEEEQRKKNKEDFEDAEKKIVKAESDQHMNVLFEVQGSLSTDEVNGLKCLLREYRIINKQQEEKIEHFMHLWYPMESKEFIAIGDYVNLRTRLLERIGRIDLVTKIEKMEDELLKQYEKGATPLQRFNSQHDGETKRLITLSQNIDKNVAGSAYNRQGGPFAFLQDVLVVIKLYLDQLAHKSESSKALYSFVDGKLKYDILALEASNVRDSESKEREIMQLKQRIVDETAITKSLEKTIKDLESKYKEDHQSWWNKLLLAKSQTTSDKERLETELSEKKAELERNRHTWEVSQQKLNEAYIKLRAEKETIASECDKQRAIMDGNFRGQEGRCEQRVKENERICDEKVQHFKSKIREMQATLATQLSEQQKMYETNMAEMQKIIDVYKDKLVNAESNKRKEESILRTGFENKIRVLENQHWDALVEWQTERSQLKRDLVEANVNLVLKP